MGDCCEGEAVGVCWDGVGLAGFWGFVTDGRVSCAWQVCLGVFLLDSIVVVLGDCIPV